VAIRLFLNYHILRWNKLYVISPSNFPTLAPTWTAFSDYTGPDLLCSTVFHF